MDQYVFIAGFCLFCFAVSATAMKFLKTTWVYFLTSATVPAMVLVAVDALWRGSLDTWADIAFVVSWLIAFGCALVYYLIKRALDKRSGRSPGTNEAMH
jgi:hypothetical protein